MLKMMVINADSIKGIFKKNISKASIAPLVIFRILFGTVMFISIIRFVAKGWIYDFYIAPKLYFPFYGFEWIKPLGEAGMYVLFFTLTLTSLLITFGYFFRIASIAFFMVFTYIELIDKTYYLNHYYFISVISFLLMISPAHRYFSIDTWRKPSLKITHLPYWCVGVFKLQIGLVYFFAGVAKINYDWLFEAMPLRIWLPANSDFPIIGELFDYVWVAYFFSWAGAIYDLSIPFLLINRKTRVPAYIILLVFHVLTAGMFSIGMFPYIMMILTLLFFSNEFHERIINALQKIFIFFSKKKLQPDLLLKSDESYNKNYFLISLLIFFFFVQITMPFRYLLYPGNLFWTEQGFRFSWRVMLMEKGGTAFFYVKDSETGRQSEVNNSIYLTSMQEKMMNTQPDMILQYAHFLDEEYKKKGIKDPVVTVESYVTLNGSGSRLFIDKNVDLSKEKESVLPKKWILPFEKID